MPIPKDIRRAYEEAEAEENLRLTFMLLAPLFVGVYDAGASKV